MDVGQQLFFQKGINDTSMEEIAEAVPVSKMTIYKYFQSKEGLLEQIMDRLLEEKKEEFRAMVRESKDTLSLLVAISNYRGMDDISVAFVTDLMRDYPAISQRMIDYQQNEILTEFEDVIYQGQKSGQIRKDISPHVLTLFIVCMKEFLGRSDQLKEIISMRVLSDQMISILYHGILTKESKGELQGE